MFDLGVYLITTLTGWLGPVQRVAAFSGIAMPERTVAGRSVQVQADDNVQLLLDFGGTCFASITTGFVIQQYRGAGLELFGTDGTINLLGDDWDPDGYELWQNSAGCWQLFKESHPDWSWSDGLRHLVECLHASQQPLVTPEHAYHVLDVMLAAQAAGEDGSARCLASTFPRLAFASAQETVAAHPHPRPHPRGIQLTSCETTVARKRCPFRATSYAALGILYDPDDAALGRVGRPVQAGFERALRLAGASSFGARPSAGSWSRVFLQKPMVGAGQSSRILSGAGRRGDWEPRQRCLLRSVRFRSQGGGGNPVDRFVSARDDCARRGFSRRAAQSRAADRNSALFWGHLLFQCRR
ncbi:MAG: hypothetical protein U1G07_15825 [Verrucomicrobiota bacterium]